MFKFKFIVYKFACVDNFEVGPKYFIEKLVELELRRHISNTLATD